MVVGAVDASPVLPLRVLPTMSLRIFRLKVSKALKLPKSRNTIALWIKMNDGTYARLDEEDRDNQDLLWWGIEDQSDVFMSIDG